MKLTITRICELVIAEYIFLWILTPTWAPLLVPYGSANIIQAIVGITFATGMSIFLVTWINTSHDQLECHAFDDPMDSTDHKPGVNKP